MSITDTRQFEAENLALARDMTQSILDDWDFIPWNELLADDVALSIKLGSIGIDRIGDIEIAGGNLQVVGRENAKHVLKSIYDYIMDDLRVTTEILSGYDVLLLGEMALAAPVRSCPIFIYMSFRGDGQIRVMTIAAIDLQPLTEAIRSAAQTATAKVS